MAGGGSCSTLGGDTYNGIGSAGGVKDRGSTNNAGRHGASNSWRGWKGGGSSLGITGRAPYNIGNVKTPNTLAGGTLHNFGLGLGSHGHGIGVIPSFLGGPHNPRTSFATVSDTQQDGRYITPHTFCFRCFGTWFVAGVVVFLVLILSGR